VEPTARRRCDRAPKLCSPVLPTVAGRATGDKATAARSSEQVGEMREREGQQ
jgi:hypothetical protein